MAAQPNIEDFFTQLKEQISDKPEIKEWEETMRKYSRAYIKNEGVKFITPDDILKHLIEQGGIVQFPLNCAIDAEAKLEKYLSGLMPHINPDCNGIQNGGHDSTD